jgi:predicted amino acid racemase
LFLNNLMQSNPAFVETVLELFRKGKIPPNSYVLDIDQIEQNAAMIMQAGRDHGLSLYFMTKQIGRNPIAIEALRSAGMDRAVAVDVAEAITLINQGVKLGNVGHLVQIPPYYLNHVLRAKPEVMTVFSTQAARNISAEAGLLGQTQDILLRVYRPDDFFYDGQAGGIPFNELEQTVAELRAMPNVIIAGVTSFPNLLVKDGVAVPTENIRTLQLAEKALRQLNIEVKQVNVPSVTCVSTMSILSENGGTHAEPGHGLTGTTPLHAAGDQPEKTAYLYLTEVSHHYANVSYVYGGGAYNRANVYGALVGKTLAEAKVVNMIHQESGNIDYYFKLEGIYPIGTPVIMASRTQMFVTRANVVPVKGIKSSQVIIEGIYTASGQRIDQ